MELGILGVELGTEVGERGRLLLEGSDSAAR